tara:strand:+ start:17162 stop:17389 length:228 start_codon:yes stop_codon:yes gene_type:complete
VVSVYISIESGATGKVQIVTGGGGHDEHTINASGWIHQTISLQKAGSLISIYGQLDSAASGDGIALLTAQVSRQS